MSADKKYTKQEIIEELKKHPDLTAGEWKKRHINPTVKTIMSYFGSWNEAKKEAGLKIKKRGRNNCKKIQEKILKEVEKELRHYHNCEKDCCEKCSEISRKMKKNLYQKYIVSVRDGWVEEKMEEFIPERR